MIHESFPPVARLLVQYELWYVSSNCGARDSRHKTNLRATQEPRSYSALRYCTCSARTCYINTQAAYQTTTERRTCITTSLARNCAIVLKHALRGRWRQEARSYCEFFMLGRAVALIASSFVAPLNIPTTCPCSHHIHTQSSFEIHRSDIYSIRSAYRPQLLRASDGKCHPHWTGVPDMAL